MPELPEVEVVRRGAAQLTLGRTITAVEVYHPRATRRHQAGSADFAAQLIGRKVDDVCRRGKYLWFVLSDLALVAHLGMSGQLLAQPMHIPPQKHLRIRIQFIDGDPELRFVDQRTFGAMFIDDLVHGVPSVLAHIAPDPLESLFDPAIFIANLRRRHTELKRALLDQTLISGIGNIYADEALWHAKLHYRMPTSQVTTRQARRLLTEITAVLKSALDKGGTSFDSLYVNVNGQSGYFSQDLAVYGQSGQPCPRCGTLIQREAFMNRSSYLCPKCQRLPK
jgi:formamidopyrimidine-DNA glycosylase